MLYNVCAAVLITLASVIANDFVGTRLVPPAPTLETGPYACLMHLLESMACPRPHEGEACVRILLDNEYKGAQSEY